MGSIDWILELLLVGLLGVTLVHAIRLERALKVLRNDRQALGDAIAGLDDSARQAEAGIGRMQFVTAETTQLLTQRVEKASALRDDLAYLIERGEGIADRLDTLVRTSRNAVSTIVEPPTVVPAVPSPSTVPVNALTNAATSVPAAPAPKVRSQAERDLLLALRGVAQ